MNITRSSLCTALEITSAALPRKASLPVYSTVRIESKQGQLSIDATDGDQFSTGSVSCESPLEPVCVAYKPLANLMPLLGENVWMEINDGKLNITSDNRHFSISTTDALQFPTWDTKGSKGIGVNCEDLAKAIEIVSFACSEDFIVKPVLCNVHIQCRDKSIVATATNGRELARMTVASIAAKCDFLLPSSFVKNFCGALRNKGAVLWLSDRKATVKYDLGEYSVKLWEGNYPSMDAFLNSDRKPLGEINPALWLPIFKTCIADNKEDLCARVFVSEGQIYFTGKTTQIELPTPDKLGACELRLNAKGVVPCLERIKGKTRCFLHGQHAVGFESDGLFIITHMLVKEAK